ncbi:hypothetical protein [Azospirillum agricola]|uniref:hypothetical protein n=1 Tax=Azospirillum agricola TaxID=1720247 RepID=UPI000A0EFB98|nr:hypothetical protein [Azospirillum agricola]SMH35622.1 hypothetical protein SAMN02982994_0896 [Azospirillum lipoferum]
MKAFVTALAAIVVLAAGARVVLPELLDRSADEAFATSSARVGEEASIAHRDFTGTEGRSKAER